MKRLLGKPNDKDASLHGIMPGAHSERVKEKNEAFSSAERLPWLSSYKLHRETLSNTGAPREEPSSEKEHAINNNNSTEVVPREPGAPRPSNTASNALNSPRLNPAVPLKKSIRFPAYKVTRPDLLSELTKMVSDGLHEIASAHPHLFPEQASPKAAQRKHHENNATAANQSPSTTALAVSSPSQSRKAPALNARDEDASLYSAERLRVYSTVFQRYVDESTLYQPLLQQIKDTYDEYIVELLDKLSAFNSSVQQVSSREIELTKQLAERDSLHAQKMSTVQQKVKELEARLAAMALEKAKSEAEAAKIREGAAAMRKEYEEMKNSCLTLTNGLSRMEDEHRNYQSQEAVRLAELTHLRASEQKSNEEIERLQQIVQNMEHLQSAMVSQDVVTNLENTVDTFRGELKRLEATHRKLLNRYASLKSVVDDCFKKFVNERQSFSEAFDDEARSKIAAVIDESVERRLANKTKNDSAFDPSEKILQMMSQGANPKLVIEVLLDHVVAVPGRPRPNIGALLDNDPEFTTGLSSTPTDLVGVKVGTISFENEESLAEEFHSPWSHFDGQGYSDTVPSYLKFHGKVQNLYLSKKDILRILEEIWQMRIACDRHLSNKQSLIESPDLENSETKQIIVSESLLSMLPINPSMAVFFENFLFDKFDKNKVLATEMAYNIMDALKRFSSVSDCRLFSAVLDEKLPIAIWMDQRQLVDKIKDEIQKDIKVLKASSGGSTDVNDDKKISSEQMMRLLRRLLPTKSDNSFSKLAKALSMDNQSGRLVNTAFIFNESDNGHRSHFLEQLKLQHINEAMSFEKHIMDCIAQFVDAGEKEMTVTKYREALTYADPHKSRADVNKLLARGCGTTVEEMLLMEAKRVLIPIEDFKKKLRMGLLQKSPPIAGKKM